MWLVAGLGNPGSQYEHTRHNIGFSAIDSIASLHNFPSWKAGYNGAWCKGKIGDVETILLKPLTFMNLSGQSVGSAARYFHIPAENVIVLHDEMALEEGRIKVKKGGGNAGHNGLKNIDEHIGKDYWRVRIGINHPGDKDAVTNYVLGKFSKTEDELIQKLLRTISEEVYHLFSDKPDNFGTKVAEKMSPPIKKEKPLNIIPEIKNLDN